MDLYDNGYSEGMAASERPDPMLMIARRNPPSASYDAVSQNWTWLPDWTEKDMDGYDLKRPYHRIVIDNRVHGPMFTWRSYFSRTNVTIRKNEGK